MQKNFSFATLAIVSLAFGSMVAGCSRNASQSKGFWGGDDSTGETEDRASTSMTLQGIVNTGACILGAVDGRGEFAQDVQESTSTIFSAIGSFFEGLWDGVAERAQELNDLATLSAPLASEEEKAIAAARLMTAAEHEVSTLTSAIVSVETSLDVLVKGIPILFRALQDEIDDFSKLPPTVQNYQICKIGTEIGMAGMIEVVATNGVGRLGNLGRYLQNADRNGTVGDEAIEKLGTASPKIADDLRRSARKVDDSPNGGGGPLCLAGGCDPAKLVAQAKSEYANAEKNLSGTDSSSRKFAAQGFGRAGQRAQYVDESFQLAVDSFKRAGDVWFDLARSGKSIEVSEAVEAMVKGGNPAQVFDLAFILNGPIKTNPTQVFSDLMKQLQNQYYVFSENGASAMANHLREQMISFVDACKSNNDLVYRKFGTSLNIDAIAYFLPK